MPVHNIKEVKIAAGTALPFRLYSLCLLLNSLSLMIYDGGLKSFAKFTGYNVASIQSCGQFKRTHQFILETWEAIYRVMIHKYF